MQAKIGKELLKALKPQDKPFEVYDTEMKGFGLRVQPPSKRHNEGVISFIVRFRFKGKQTRYTIGQHPVFTPAQARDKAKDILASVTKGEDPMTAKKTVREQTFDSFLTEVYGPWVQTHRKTGKATMERLEACFKKDFGKKPLPDITAWIVEKWRTARLKNGIKPSTVNRDLTALKAALAKAVEWGHLPEHPLKKVKPSEVNDSGKVRFLSPEEEKRLRDALAQREEKIRKGRDNANTWREDRGYDLLPNLRTGAFADHLKPLVLISLNTGLRRAELFRLTWENVDLQKAILTIPGSSAKSGKPRHVPLNGEALSVLNGWQKQTDGEAGLCFPGKKGKPMHDVNTAWENLMEAAKIESFRWHDMRHHFASWLVMAGVDLNTVRELLGHADLKMTLRYAHLAPGHKAAAVEKLTLARLTGDNHEHTAGDNEGFRQGGEAG
jgi:integrase